LTTDFLPELKLRVSGAVPLLPLYAFTASSGMSFTSSYCLQGSDILLSGRNLSSFFKRKLRPPFSGSLTLRMEQVISYKTTRRHVPHFCLNVEWERFFLCLFPWASAAKPRMYCSLLAYCTARFGRSNFGHQMPPRLPTRSAL
jgi:hypothetical protein